MVLYMGLNKSLGFRIFNKGIWVHDSIGMIWNPKESS